MEGAPDEKWLRNILNSTNDYWICSQVKGITTSFRPICFTSLFEKVDVLNGLQIIEINLLNLIVGWKTKNLMYCRNVGELKCYKFENCEKIIDFLCSSTQVETINLLERLGSKLENKNYNEDKNTILNREKHDLQLILNSKQKYKKFEIICNVCKKYKLEQIQLIQYVKSKNWNLNSIEKSDIKFLFFYIWKT